MSVTVHKCKNGARRFGKKRDCKICNTDQDNTEALHNALARIKELEGEAVQKILSDNMDGHNMPEAITHKELSQLIFDWYGDHGGVAVQSEIDDLINRLKTKIVIVKKDD